jgi:DNA-binding beta-propeller fold protein YncE
MLYWPFPPEKPRIKFEDLIVGSIDATGVRSGKFSHLFFGEEGEKKFIKPSFVAVRDGVMYVTDIGAVHVYDFAGKKYGVIKGPGIITPSGVAAGPDGRVYVGETSRKKVFIFDSGGKEVGSIAGFSAPAGLAIDAARGRLVVSDAKEHKISVFDLGGKPLFAVSGRGDGPGQLNIPYDVAVDRQGRIYVVDSGNFRIQIFDSEGKFVRAFGQVGTMPGQFARPRGIALDSEGHIYVVDAAFGNFQIFDEFGNVYLAVGQNGVEPGEFQLPSGIAITDDDRIYVADQINKRIQVFRYIKYEGEGPLY